MSYHMIPIIFNTSKVNTWDDNQNIWSNDKKKTGCLGYFWGIFILPSSVWGLFHKAVFCKDPGSLTNQYHGTWEGFVSWLIGNLWEIFI